MTPMSEQKCVKVRPLSHPEFREGFEGCWTGKMLDIDFADAAAPEWDLGSLVEVESGTRIYLGVLQESGESGISILVEHMLDRGEIQWIPDVWG